MNLSSMSVPMLSELYKFNKLLFENVLTSILWTHTSKVWLHAAIWRQIRVINATPLRVAVNFFYEIIQSCLMNYNDMKKLPPRIKAN